MPPPLVSVVTTVHDLEPYVERCISSVLDQSYERWEQIIVDDGSTDGTASRIAQFTDPRIRYVRLPHRGITGLADGYNTALAHARGELVAVLEGDDFWPAHKLALQVEAFDDPAVQLTWGNAVVVDERDRLSHAWPRPRLRESEIPFSELFHRLTCANILTPTVTVMIRRAALDAVGGFHQPAGVLYVDLPTWLMVSATVSGKARRLDAHLGYYRVHDAQMSTEHQHAYQTSQVAVVDAVVSRLGPSALARLGWDERRQREARASAELASGLEALRQGKSGEARLTLGSALRGVRSPRSRLRAALGFISTFVPYNFVAAADTARRALLGLPFRVRRAERASR